MFRAAVVSVMFAVAVGPNASLLCRAWCDPLTAVSSGCHTEDSATTTTVVKGDGCETAAFSVAPFLGQQARRDAVAGAMEAVALPPSVVGSTIIIGVSQAIDVAQSTDRDLVPLPLRI